MGLRRQSREGALQALFMCDFLNRWNIDAVDFCFDHFGVGKLARSYAATLCSGVVENVVKIDSKLTCMSEHWSVSRMGRVDRTILRIALYEIIFCSETPINVIINEAIEIAKRFGSEDSPMFVNGILDRAGKSFRNGSDQEVQKGARCDGREDSPVVAVVGKRR